MPVSLTLDDVKHQPVDPMHFQLDMWCPTPWEEVLCKAISMSDTEVVVMCQVSAAVRMQPQQHGPWSESLVMVEGELYENTTGETFRPGSGLYYQAGGTPSNPHNGTPQSPQGQIHVPEFKGPARCVITWRFEPQV